MDSPKMDSPTTSQKGVADNAMSAEEKLTGEPQKDQSDLHEAKEQENHTANGGGDIEAAILLRKKRLHHAGLSPDSREGTPNTARRRKHLRHLDEVYMAEMISLSGIESMCTMSNFDATSMRDANEFDDEEEDDEKGEEEEEKEEGGTRVHHILAVLLAMASIAVILLLYFLVPCPCEPHNWNVQIENMVATSPIRLIDVDRDGMEDMIFGFGYSLDYEAVQDMEQRCEQLNVSTPCGGGVVAMSGWQGEELWTLRTNQSITSLVCNQLDVNGDGQTDCLVAGYDGQMMAVDSRTGAMLWGMDSSVARGDWSISQPQVLPMDLDADGVLDVVVAHGSGNTSEAGQLLLLSGKTGQSLGSPLMMPDAMTTGCPPIIYQASNEDGEENEAYVVFGSGSSSVQGSMWLVSLEDLFDCAAAGSDCNVMVVTPDQYQANSYVHTRAETNSEAVVIELLRGNESGFELPAIIADMTLDGVNDIIIVSHDARISVLNGTNLQAVWEVDRYVASHRILSLPAPGHFNKDDVPDLYLHLTASSLGGDDMDKHVVLDGVTGEELWSTLSKSSDLSPLTAAPLSLKGTSPKDAFTFWYAALPEEQEAPTTKAGGDWCSNLDVFLPTLHLLLMDRDMAMSVPSLFTASPSLYSSNSSSTPSPDHTTSTRPISTGATSRVTLPVSIATSSMLTSDATAIPTSGATSLPLMSTSSSTDLVRRRRDVGSAMLEDCFTMEPVISSTGVLGDFDNDGSLEYILTINMMSSSAPPHQGNHLVVQRFGLKEALDQDRRTSLVPEDTFVSPVLGNDTTSGSLSDHFEFLAPKDQSWWAYMGTSSDSRYR